MSIDECSGPATSLIWASLPKAKEEDEKDERVNEIWNTEAEELGAD